MLVCHYIHGMSLREVAEVLGIQEEAAKKRAQRALKKLKVAMSRNGDFERTVIKHGT